MGRYHHIAYIMPDRRGENIQLLFVFWLLFWGGSEGEGVAVAAVGGVSHKVTLATNVRLAGGPRS